LLTLNAAGIASSQDKPVTSVGQVTTGASVSAGVVIVHEHELKTLPASSVTTKVAVVTPG